MNIDIEIHFNDASITKDTFYMKRDYISIYKVFEYYRATFPVFYFLVVKLPTGDVFEVSDRGEITKRKVE